MTTTGKALIGVVLLGLVFLFAALLPACADAPPEAAPAPTGEVDDTTDALTLFEVGASVVLVGWLIDRGRRDARRDRGRWS